MSISSAFAVSMMIGTELFARIRRHTSRPSIFGSMMSSTTRSNRSLSKLLQRLLPVERGHDLVALLLERIAEQLLDGLLVVDEQDACGSAACLVMVVSPHLILGDCRRIGCPPIQAAASARSLIYTAHRWSICASTGRRSCPPCWRWSSPCSRSSRVRAPHASDLAPDAFSGADALSRHPRASRSGFRTGAPGAPATRRLGGRRRDALPHARPRDLARSGSSPTWTARSSELSNVIGRLRGRSDREVVIMAHRDSAGRPGAASASGTAVLLELAQALDALDRTKTIVFVSTDGATADDAGARRFAEHYRGSAQGGRRRWCSTTSARPSPRRPFVVPWSTGLEPRVAGGRAHRRGGAASRDRSRRPGRSRGSVSGCAWRGRSRCASRARWCAPASTR